MLIKKAVSNTRQTQENTNRHNTNLKLAQQQPRVEDTI